MNPERATVGQGAAAGAKAFRVQAQGDVLGWGGGHREEHSSMKRPCRRPSPPHLVSGHRWHFAAPVSTASPSSPLRP